MNEAVIEILKAVILFVVSAAITVGTYYLKAWLSQKMTAEEREALKKQIEDTVRAAEQLAITWGWTGEGKKAWVTEQFSKMTGVPQDELNVLIEAAVQQLKVAGEELVKA